MATTTHPKTDATWAGDATAWLELVRRQVDSLRFGVVQIVVHNGKVSQIDRTERLRLEPSSISMNLNQPDHWRE
jgi:hypothetical protein